jgi:hypothetical protein
MCSSIVAVAGLAGHAIGSWSAPNGSMWLRDELPQDIPNARVLTYGYAADTSLHELADEFMTYLLAFRGRTERVRISDVPILFISNTTRREMNGKSLYNVVMRIFLLMVR